MEVNLLKIPILRIDAYSLSGIGTLSRVYVSTVVEFESWYCLG